MRTILLLLISVSLTVPVFADDLPNQLERLKAAQDDYEAVQMEAAEAQAERERQAEERRQAEIRAAQRAQDERRRAAAAKAQAENDERLRDKARLQTMQEEEHSLDIELKRAKVAEAKALSAARAQRANEFVDADVAKQKAEADVVQSQADATRNVSEGLKEFQTGAGKGLEAAGRGVEAEGNSWFK